MNRTRVARSLLAAAATTILLAVSVLATAAPAAAHGITPSSVGSSAWADFDGDGIGDLAIGMPEARVGSHEGAGAVVIVYGSPTGLDPVRHQEFDQGTTGIQGAAEARDAFGRALAAGDVDADGFSDLIVGIPYEDDQFNGHNYVDAGAISVIYGSAHGLTTRDRLYFPKSNGVDPSHAAFGWSVVALDAYNGTTAGHDGKADVAAGLPGARSFKGGYAILSSALLRPGGSGPAKIVRGGSHFGSLGYTIAAGDFDSDGTDDLVLGAPLATIDDPAHPGQQITDAGEVHVVYGGGSHPRRILAEGTNGVPGKPGENDLFGVSLAVAHDPAGNAYDSLWVGAPSHATNGVSRSGIVYRFDAKSNGSGIDPTGATYHEGPAGFGDTLESDDEFGSAIAVGEFGRGAGLDVAVGAIYEDVGSKNGAGAVFVSYGDGTNDMITQDKAGYAGTSNSADGYGNELFAANFGNGGTLDLAIGAAFQSVNHQVEAGQVHVLYGSATAGFTGSNDQTLDLGSGLGLGLQPAHFGRALH